MIKHKKELENIMGNIMRTLWETLMTLPSDSINSAHNVLGPPSGPPPPSLTPDNEAAQAGHAGARLG